MGMIADMNLQAWLETNSAAHPPMVTPYIQSAESQRIRYQLYAVRKGASGTSRVGQSGAVMARAGQPTALSRFSLNVGQGDKCRIALTLVTARQTRKSYDFDCPR